MKRTSLDNISLLFKGVFILLLRNLYLHFRRKEKMTKISSLGYPRLGEKREWKKLIEGYWARTVRQNELFEGSKYLLLYADKIEEIKTICWYCHKKASMNMRVVDGVPVYTGEQIQIGGNDAYYPVCRYHYNHPGEERL